MKNLTPTGGGCAVESKRQFTIIIFSLCFFLKLIETLEFSFTIIIYVRQGAGEESRLREKYGRKKERKTVYIPVMCLQPFSQ